jgi:uncharacterized protein YbjT (DUF2867 family)
MSTTLSSPLAADETVLVIGATGRTGAMIVSELCTLGISVRALARDADKARHTLPAEAEIVAGDVTSFASVEAAVQGAGILIFCASATAGGSAGNTPDLVDYGGVVNAVDAAKAAHMDYFVLFSSASTTQPEHPHNVMFNSVLKWKFKGEEYVRNSGLRYSIIRPLGLRDYEANIKGIRLVQGDRILCGEEISRADVAALCVGFLGNPDVLNKTFEAYNDATIDPGVRPATFAGLK